MTGPRLLCLSVLLLSAGCATTNGVPSPEEVGARIEKEAGYRVRVAAGAPELPPGVDSADGLTQSEAVAIALWNSPAFLVSLADLGIARADVAQAGLLRNPVFSLLFPWGPKQLEWTLRWPLDAIWQRPKRIAAARAAADAVAERLVAGGVTLVTDVKLAHADLAAAQGRVAVANEAAALARRFSDIVRKRFEAGDISQLEADAAAVDAKRAEQVRARATLEVGLAAGRLHELMGIGDTVRPADVRAADVPLAVPAGCADLHALEKDTLAARPEVRAAELEIEAAAQKLGWERMRIFTLVAVLDANGEGKEGFEMGPGLDSDLGLFDRNQAGVMRASAELGRGRARYVASRAQVLREVRDAHAQYLYAQAAITAWRDDIRPSLERQMGQTMRAYEAGELPFLAVLEATRRLNDGIAQELDAVVGMRRALVLLERSAGRSCGAMGSDQR
jgi:cobalt-zinc-cadmium efflux system outer membrane protein